MNSEEHFCIAVHDDSLAELITTSGRVRAGWVLFVDARRRETVEPGALVAADTPTGQLAVGILHHTGGWSVDLGGRRQEIERTGVLGEVVELHPPAATISWEADGTGDGMRQRLRLVGQ